MKVFLDLPDNYRLRLTALPSTTVCVYSGGSPPINAGRSQKKPEVVGTNPAVDAIPCST